jgi:hypothetical protein
LGLVGLLELLAELPLLEDFSFLTTGLLEGLLEEPLVWGRLGPLRLWLGLGAGLRTELLERSLLALLVGLLLALFVGLLLALFWSFLVTRPPRVLLMLALAGFLAAAAGFLAAGFLAAGFFFGAAFLVAGFFFGAAFLAAAFFFGAAFFFSTLPPLDI